MEEIGGNLRRFCTYLYRGNPHRDEPCSTEVDPGLEVGELLVRILIRLAVICTSGYCLSTCTPFVYRVRVHSLQLRRQTFPVRCALGSCSTGGRHLCRQDRARLDQFNPQWFVRNLWIP